MTILYSDPYKDNKFGKLKGDKKDTYFKVIFEEVKIYKHENSYIVAGQFNAYMGVTRAYKPEESLVPGLCELPIYGSDYEIRQKKAGTGTREVKAEYETIKLQPSIAEKIIYEHFENNPDSYSSDSNSFTGEITFYPDDTYIAMPDDSSAQLHILGNTKINPVESTGKYPDWTAPKPYSKSGNYNNKLSLDDKLVFLKSELAETVNDHNIRSDKTLPIAAYVHKILDENQNNERFLKVYFDLVQALVN